MTKTQIQRGYIFKIIQTLGGGRRKERNTDELEPELSSNNDREVQREDTRLNQNLNQNDGLRIHMPVVRA